MDFYNFQCCEVQRAFCISDAMWSKGGCSYIGLIALRLRRIQRKLLASSIDLDLVLVGPTPRISTCNLNPSNTACLAAYIMTVWPFAPPTYVSASPPCMPASRRPNLIDFVQHKGGERHHCIHIRISVVPRSKDVYLDVVQNSFTGIMSNYIPVVKDRLQQSC